MNISEMSEQRKERPAYVRFERVALEDHAASLKAGHYVAKDVDMALITPPYTKDVFKVEVDQWMQTLDSDVRNERFPKEWADRYKEAYRAWQNGQEMPLHGTPIKGWGVISPAQQETLIRMNILTVEDLSLINQDGIGRIGMGALDLKTKASAWLAQLQDKGPLTQKMAAVEKENAILKSSVETLTRQVEELTALAKSQFQAPRQAPQAQAPQAEAITAADLLEPEDIVAAYTQKFGKPPHHRMKPETIRAALE